MASTPIYGPRSATAPDIESVTPLHWVAVRAEHRFYALLVLSISAVEAMIGALLGNGRGDWWFLLVVLVVAALPQTAVISRQQTRFLALKAPFPRDLAGSPVMVGDGRGRLLSWVALVLLVATMIALFLIFVRKPEDCALCVLLQAGIMAGQGLGYLIGWRKVRRCERREGGVLVRLALGRVRVHGEKSTWSERRAMARWRFVVFDDEARAGRQQT